MNYPVCGWLTILGILGTATVQARDYPPVEVTMDLVQVSEHCYYVRGASGAATENQGFIANAGVIVTGEGVVLIDALGTPSLAQLLQKRIAELTDQSVVAVIVTHYHADHVYGLQVFADQGVEIIAPEGAQTYLEDPGSQDLLQARRQLLTPWVDEDTRLVAPDRIVTDQEVLTFGEVRLTLTHMGAAHSEGDLAVLVAPDRVLYSGDIIFEGRVPFVGSADTRQWLAALEGLDGVDLAALVPGHGGHARDPNAAVGLTRDYLAFLRAQMGEAVADMLPFDLAYEEVDWSDYETLPAFEAANRRNAYQVYLDLEAEQFE